VTIAVANVALDHYYLGVGAPSCAHERGERSIPDADMWASGIKHNDVCSFAWLQGSHFVINSERSRRVNGGHLDRFFD
jgi:hypothetical protein